MRRSSASRRNSCAPRNTAWKRAKRVGKARSTCAAAPAGFRIVELGLAGYFLFTTIYSVTVENYLTTPFLLLFFMGYTYMGTMSLFQTPLRRLANALPALFRPRAVEPAT